MADYVTIPDLDFPTTSTQEQRLQGIADAIRAKEGSTSPISANDFASRIRDISTGIDTSDATAGAGDILLGKTVYAQDSKVTGTIPTKTSNDLSVSGSTVTAPAGFYAQSASKSVETATQATPTISVGADGKITASATQEAGYVQAGTKSATQQMTTQAAKTVTPSTSEQIVVNSGVYTTGDIKVAAVPSGDVTAPSITVNESGLINATVRQSAGYIPALTRGSQMQLDTQGATTVIPTASDQIAVASGIYTTGNIIVAGDANLVPENIKSGVSIFGVTGDYVTSSDNDIANAVTRAAVMHWTCNIDNATRTLELTYTSLSTARAIGAYYFMLTKFDLYNLPEYDSMHISNGTDGVVAELLVPIRYNTAVHNIRGNFMRMFKYQPDSQSTDTFSYTSSPSNKVTLAPGTSKPVITVQLTNGPVCYGKYRATLLYAK